MLIYLLRHGLTQDNQEKRYQGRRDVPLCPQGLAQLCRADFAPKTVMITSLQRTRQTAEVLFPDAELVVADGLKEMDFGVFEGRNYREMEHDPQYRAWVETGCEGRCPGGESKAEFCQRVCTAFAALVDALHAAGIAVLMDFVPVHFAPDADRLACFDGAPLFESGPSDWDSLNFDLASPPVRSFLLSSAAFWLQVCRCDGLRVDAIGNALYHCPNGWQAAEFFKTLTAGLHARFPGCMLVAEDSAGSMNATSDTASGGLGFDYVWEIGWTQDTLAYFAAPFGGRSALFRQLCGSFGPFGAVQGINALSHDENHPASIFTRLYGNVEEKLAQMRLLLLLQAARPGKSLLFAGVEFGQPDAFTDGREPNWAMLADAGHRALADYSKALNTFCLAHPALYAPQSFAWTAQDASTGVLGFTLQAGCETLLCALNTGTQAVQGFGLKPGWGSCALPLFAAGWVDNAPRPIANGWLALDLAPLSGGIWQIE